MTAGFFLRHFPSVFPFKFASVGSLLFHTVKNEKKQLFHQIHWLIVETADPLTSLDVDTDVLCELRARPLLFKIKQLDLLLSLPQNNTTKVGREKNSYIRVTCTTCNTIRLLHDLGRLQEWLEIE